VHDRELDVPKEKERERDVEHENNNIVNVLTIRHFFFGLHISRGGNVLKARKTWDFFVMLSETTIRRKPKITWLIVNVKKDGSVCKFSLVLHVVVVVFVGVHDDGTFSLTFLFFYFLFLSQHL
jgi:hypothetical protein